MTKEIRQLDLFIKEQEAKPSERDKKTEQEIKNKKTTDIFSNSRKNVKTEQEYQKKLEKRIRLAQEEEKKRQEEREEWEEKKRLRILHGTAAEYTPPDD